MHAQIKSHFRFVFPMCYGDCVLIENILYPTTLGVASKLAQDKKCFNEKEKMYTYVPEKRPRFIDFSLGDIHFSSGFG